MKGLGVKNEINLEEEKRAKYITQKRKNPKDPF